MAPDLLPIQALGTEGEGTVVPVRQSWPACLSPGARSPSPCPIPKDPFRADWPQDQVLKLVHPLLKERAVLSWGGFASLRVAGDIPGLSLCEVPGIQQVEAPALLPVARRAPTRKNHPAVEPRGDPGPGWGQGGGPWQRREPHPHPLPPWGSMGRLGRLSGEDSN